VRRGLRGVKLVISDAHEGLKAAVAKVLHARRGGGFCRAYTVDCGGEGRPDPLLPPPAESHSRTSHPSFAHCGQPAFLSVAKTSFGASPLIRMSISARLHSALVKGDSAGSRHPRAASFIFSAIACEGEFVGL
jgi:hypothetical protein